MSLFSESLDLFSWLGRIIGEFLRVKRGTTLLVIAAAAMARVTNLLAFLLPLKIILLAGSDGVPHYFQAFINPDHKLPWIIGLSAAAIVSYAATLALDALTKRLSQAGSLEVLQGANEMAVVSNQQAEGQGYYTRFTQLVANLLFGIAGLGLMLPLNPWLFAWLITLFMAMFLFSTWGLRDTNLTNPPPVAAFIQNNQNDYMKILTSVSFLSAFLVILHPFLTTAHASILVAIVSIVVLRQTLRALADAISDVLRLIRRKDLINALVFREHQWRPLETRERRTLRDAFQKAERQRVIERELDNVLDIHGPVDVRWTDPVARGVNGFALLAKLADGTSCRLQLQVFSQRQLHLPENEELLFDHIPREQLNAPPAMTRFSHGPFECQICDHGRGRGVPLTRWKDVYLRLITQLWSCKPPDALVEAYNASHLLLQDRLSDELIARVDVAVDDQTEAKVLKTFQSRLQRIRAELAEIPLFVANPDLNSKNVVVVEKGRFYVMNWGRWALEPLSADLAVKLKPDELSAMVANVRKHRADIAADLGASHLIFARDCRRMERYLLRGAYKAALRIAAKLLKNPVVKQKAPV